MSSIKFTTKVNKWGDSDAIRIKADAIVFTPVTLKNINELFKGWYDDGKRDTELDWGHSQRNELKW